VRNLRHHDCLRMLSFDMALDVIRATFIPARIYRAFYLCMSSMVARSIKCWLCLWCMLNLLNIKLRSDQPIINFLGASGGAGALLS
jgi:hypothetical protein